jgi:hypothetical protein
MLIYTESNFRCNYFTRKNALGLTKAQLSFKCIFYIRKIAPSQELAYAQPALNLALVYELFSKNKVINGHKSLAYQGFQAMPK